MNPPSPDLAPLHRFYRALPVALRRLHPDELRRDPTLLDDLRQEVALDYLANRAQLAATAVDDRHRRWLRLVGRCHYDLRQRGRRLFSHSPVLDQLAAAPGAAVGAAVGDGDRGRDCVVADHPPLDDLDGEDAAFAHRLMTKGVRRKNGRLNQTLTARSFDLEPDDLRARQARLATALGTGDRFVRFWRRRLVEALLGLAADVLRDRDLVTVHDRPPRELPDPEARVRRLRNIRNKLRFFPLPRDLKRVLARYGDKARSRHDPRRALISARELEPRRGDIHLWLFELAVIEGDHAAAAAALRAARCCADTDRGAALLARARLLEARGRPAAAAAALERGRRRLRDDPRLVISLNRLRA